MIDTLRGAAYEGGNLATNLFPWQERIDEEGNRSGDGGRVVRVLERGTGAAAAGEAVRRADAGRGGEGDDGGRRVQRPTRRGGAGREPAGGNRDRRPGADLGRGGTRVSAPGGEEREGPDRHPRRYERRREGR